MLLLINNLQDSSLAHYKMLKYLYPVPINEQIVVILCPLRCSLCSVWTYGSFPSDLLNLFLLFLHNGANVLCTTINSFRSVLCYILKYHPLYLFASLFCPSISFWFYLYLISLYPGNILWIQNQRTILVCFILCFHCYFLTLFLFLHSQLWCKNMPPYYV